MYTKYCIDITKVGNSLKYSCAGEEKVYYIVKYINCPCGVLYQEPIVQINCSYKIHIFVSGITQTDNKLLRNNIVTDPNLNTLTSEIAEHHSVSYEVVLHSIHRGIAYLKYQHGQDIEYEGCPDILED